MTIDALTINGKDLSELDSKQTTELITALFTHRKQLNEDKRGPAAPDGNGVTISTTQGGTT
jgi:hypothetical protein